MPGMFLGAMAASMHIPPLRYLRLERTQIVYDAFINIAQLMAFNMNHEIVHLATKYTF
jgi:hypothetical protein